MAEGAVPCAACERENPAGAKFCNECGAALMQRCPSCGAEQPPTAKFCNQCGTAHATGAALALDLTTDNLTTNSLPSGERRQLTVLFCDLVGSTPLSQQLDAEEWRDLIAQYQQAAAGAVARFGGHVAKNLGDGLLIYFGWPTAREDDPERAVRAGLAIVEAVRSLDTRPEKTAATRDERFGSTGPESTPFTPSSGPSFGPRIEGLSVRVGMHTGPVVIADGGEVFGETANVAARVQGAAEPDTVVITAATQRLVAGLFVVEERGARSTSRACASR